MPIESFVGMVVSAVLALVLNKFKKTAKLYEMLAMNVGIREEGNG